MSSSYKPALLKALVRLVRRGIGDQIPLLDIGREFVDLYWVQTVVFRLRQAATITSEPEVVRHIRTIAELRKAHTVSDLPKLDRDRLDREMARILTINVLSAFHKSKPIAMDPLYQWSLGERVVRMSESAGSFVSTNAPVLESLANLWWAKYLEKVNLLAPMVIEKVERDGAKRGSLTRFLRILRQTDDARCFYCGCSFDLERHAVHVDHVIPWSFMLADPVWNLVLACATCNITKSDVLPDRKFLANLVRVGARRSQTSFPPNFASPFITGEEIDRFYDAALSVEWPSGWAPP